MRTLSRCLGGLLVVALAAGFARAQDDPKDIIAKAIKAHGGEEKLTKLKATKLKAKGTIEMMGNSADFTLEAVSQQPGQLRNEIKLEVMGMNVTILQVLNKDKGWLSFNGMTMALEGDPLDEFKEQAYGDYIESLVPLLRDKEFKLEALGESKVEGKPAIGVKVSAKDHKDIKLFFDKESNLLVKSQKRGKDMGMNEIDIENFMSGYKDVSGVKTAMKMLVKHDGNKFIEGEVTEVKLLEKVEDSNFEKP